MNNYDKHNGGPTRAYTGLTGYSVSSDPGYSGYSGEPERRRRDYEEPAGSANPNWGAPPKPPAMEDSKFAVSASFIVGGAGVLMSFLVFVTNELLPTTAGGSRSVQRDVLTSGIGAAFVTLVAAVVLVGLIHRAARPGLVFAAVSGLAVVIATFVPALAGQLTSWQAWVSTALVNAIVFSIAAGLLYALGRGSINTNVVQRY